MFTAYVARKILTIGVVIAVFKREVLAGVQSIKVSLVYTRKSVFPVIGFLTVYDS